MVEHRLAKARVESSNLFSRSKQTLSFSYSFLMLSAPPIGGVFACLNFMLSVRLGCQRAQAHGLGGRKLLL